MGVKIYGSTSFTPTDLPTGTTLERADMPYIWAGCLGNCSPCPDGCPGYEPPNWRTLTGWSFGGYGSETLNTEELPTDKKHVLASIQDESTTSGWASFLNGNGANKRVLGQAGTDLPENTTINYVRVWMKGGTFSGPPKYAQPFWQSTVTASGTLDATGSSSFPSISSGTSWGSPRLFVLTTGSYNTIQSSPKWTYVPGSTSAWTPELMANRAWGVRHSARYNDGNPGEGSIHVCEMAIEVGYDSVAQYSVVTGPALSVDGTSATVTGTVNPYGDVSGFDFFQYGPTTALGTNTTLIAQPSSTTHDTLANLTSLTPNTQYWYRAAARDSAGDYHYGAKLTFLTVSACSTRSVLIGG